MAIVTFGNELRENYRVRDFFPDAHGIISTQRTDTQTIVSYFDAANASIQGRYYANSPGANITNFPISKMTSGQNSSAFVWQADSGGPLNIGDLSEFHLGGAKGAATLMKGDDTITGGLNENYLEGYAGDDTIDGGNDSDRLIGGLGKDTLIGGDDDDLFVFKDVRESTVKIKGRDIIEDFSRREHDKIHLGAIDANEHKKHDQDFRFIGDDHFHRKAGELRYEKFIDGIVVQGDTDGNGRADFSIELQDMLNIRAGDFVL